MKGTPLGRVGSSFMILKKNSHVDVTLNEKNKQ